MKLGVIGDDFTGSSDIALMLASGGMSTVQYVGIPTTDAAGSVEAGVISLKSRSIPASEAIEQSLAALAWLQAQGCQQFVFKYCSTFDSTAEGNIGPVTEALISALGTPLPVIVCPAFPATGRTLYQGHLFVQDRLLSESGMQNHPLTPMKDPDLRRCLQAQVSASSSVGHVPLHEVRGEQLKQAMLREAEAGRQMIICDAVDNDDLLKLAQASCDFPLLTGGSGIALGLPEVHQANTANGSVWEGAKGQALALSGSCSIATRAQIAHHRENGGAQLRVSVADIIADESIVQETLAWALKQNGLPLVYTSDDPSNVEAEQQRYGKEASAEAIERFFASLATLAVNSGVVRVICAGGETSGAIVSALGMSAMIVGPMIDPGVPALQIEDTNVVLALKSGNFGAVDFFNKADAILAGE